jgi:hypothetical protein
MPPRSSTIASSVTPSTMCGCCSTTIDDRPSSRATRRIARSSSATMIGARPSSGSSSSSSRVEHQRAAEGQHLLLAARQLRAEVAAALGQAREQSKTRFGVQGPGRATAVRFSSTVSDLKMLRSCGTQPMPAAARRCTGSV